MRVFLVGASGAIGRPLIPKLMGAGHQVTGLTRSSAKADLIQQLGAESVIGDVFDLPRLTELLRAAQPDVVISQLTDLPQKMELRKLATYYEANNRVRRDGTANVINAALQVGVRRAVIESMAIWYAPGDGAHKTEDAPLYVNAPEPVGEAVRALEAMEAHARASELDVVILRYGAFYGPGTWLATGGYLWTEVKKRSYPIVGDGAGVYSWIHVDDAAAATVVALDKATAGTYNVVDDEPAPTQAWLPFYADVIGAQPPHHVPQIMARFIGGGIVDWQATMPPASNGKIKRELGWQPRYPTWRVGFREALG